MGMPANAGRLAEMLQAGLHLPMLPAARHINPVRVADPDCTWHIVDAAWLGVFERMRKCVLDEIARRRVVVESCPSSNLAVVGLHEPPLERFLADGVRCAVATDDPGMLDAWPRREIGYLRCQTHGEHVPDGDARTACPECEKYRRYRDRVSQQNRSASFITRTASR